MTYSPEQEEANKALYLDLLARGKTERDLDCLPDFPKHTHRNGWTKDSEFSEQCKRARAVGAEYVLHEAEEKLQHAWQKADDEAASPQLVSVTGEIMKHARWKASKYSPLYSDKETRILTGPDGGPIETRDNAMSDDELNARILELAAKAGTGAAAKAPGGKAKKGGKKQP